jgi:hypothetical protein
MGGTMRWEFLTCGSHQDCPAYPQKGSSCWNVEGTLCRGKRQGDYESKIEACRTSCPYYNGVMDGSIKIS